MTKCAKCKKEFSEEPHVVERDIGSDATRKRYPTMKVCNNCFEEGYNKDILLNKLVKTTTVDTEIEEIRADIPIEVYVDPAFIGSPEEMKKSMVVINKETREIIPTSLLEEVMLKDLPNFEIERRCTQCGKWFDVTVSTNRDDMRISTKLCPHCKHNNQIFVRIKRIDDIEKLRENAKHVS